MLANGNVIDTKLANFGCEPVWHGAHSAPLRGQTAHKVSHRELKGLSRRQRTKAAEAANDRPDRHAEAIKALQQKVDARRQKVEALQQKIEALRKQHARKIDVLLRAQADATLSFQSRQAEHVRQGKALSRELGRSRANVFRLQDQISDARAAAFGLHAILAGSTLQPSAPGQTGTGPDEIWARTGLVCQSLGDLAGAAACYRRAPSALRRLLRIQAEDGVELAGPDFMIIGAARGGTTWLRKCLCRHPDVRMLGEEPSYFFKAPSKSPLSYVASFLHGSEAAGSRPKPAAVRAIFGEKSPGYLDMPSANIDLCAALFPSVRLVCVLREPISRAWSELTRRSAIEGADDLERLRLSHDLDGVVQYGRYRQHLLRWTEHFPPEQLLLIDFEQISNDPAATYASVLDHIGAAPFSCPEDVLHQVVGPGAGAPAPPSLLRAFLESAYADEPWRAGDLMAEFDLARRSGRPPGSLIRQRRTADAAT